MIYTAIARKHSWRMFRRHDEVDENRNPADVVRYLDIAFEYSMTFTVKGYYGSQFTPSGLDSTAVPGALPILLTAASLNQKEIRRTDDASAQRRSGEVRAVVDNAKVLVDLNRIPTATGLFMSRVRKENGQNTRDADRPQAGFAISTSSLSKAEFNAVGISTIPLFCQ